MEPLGLTDGQYRRYIELLFSPHDFEIHVDVLDMEENHVTSATKRFIDGQADLQRGAAIKRTATLSFRDPNHSLHLDSDSVFDGAVFADRMIRVRHVVDLPGFGEVHATPFIGPINRVSRSGDILTVEGQDKTVLAIEGVPHKTVKKGRNAVEAIREIMADCTGERRFRFPKNHKARLARSYSVGWKTEASPWRVCQKIADQIGMQLVYACDGALLLRNRPTKPLLKVTENTALTGPPTSDYDMTTVRNWIRFTGEVNKKKHIDVGAVAHPKAGHRLSAQSLGRNGVPRYLPETIDDSGVRKHKVAKARAERRLKEKLPMGVTASAPIVPVFHMDYGDPILVRSDRGDLVMPLVEGVIPFGLAGDAEIGALKTVSNPKRRA